VLQYLPYLRDHGVDASIHFYKWRWQEKLQFYNNLGQYDILYIHRKLFSPFEFWYIHKKAPKIIYDFDDALMYRSSGSKNPYSSSRRIKFDYMMKRVDFVIAGNQFLKSEVLPYNHNVEVIPTSIDLARYHLKEYGRRKDHFIIGWLGSRTTLKYLPSLIPVLEKIFQKDPRVKLKMVCDQFLDDLRVPVIKKRWSLDEEVEDLRSFDIGVMPLSNDLWSKGKCGLKILQYFGVGIPVVCTPIGVNRDIVEDGVSGFWAGNEEEWENCLSRLIEDERLRREMGLRGRNKVEKGYSLEVNAPQVLDVLDQVASEKDKRN
jgi:glycosyltransferase involved in cell wall biosynthesis